MVVLNKNELESKLSTVRFGEVIKGFTSGTDIITLKEIPDINEINVPAKSAMIIELK
jgi:hypothetical protein